MKDKNEKKFIVKIIPPRHIKNKKIHFAPFNESAMANKLPSTNY